MSIISWFLRKQLSLCLPSSVTARTSSSDLAMHYSFEGTFSPLIVRRDDYSPAANEAWSIACTDSGALSHQIVKPSRRSRTSDNGLS